MTTDHSKVCTKCGEAKPHFAYYHRNGKPIAACKDCTKAARREYVAAHHEEIKADLRARHHADRERAIARLRTYWAENAERLRQQKRDHYAANREKIAQEGAAYRAANPEKMEARRLLKLAVERRDLTREPCLFCDSPHSEGHHHDYTKPFDVTWLCKRHHGLVHRTVSQPMEDAA